MSLTSLQPFFLLRDSATIVRPTIVDDGHGGQRTIGYTDYATVRARFYMSGGGDPVVDPATGKTLLSPQRGTIWLDASQIPDGKLPSAGERIRLDDGRLFQVLNANVQGQMCMVTLGEPV